MRESENSLRFLPLDHPTKIMVDAAITKNIEREQNDGYTLGREGVAYVHQFGGLEHVFNYARRLGSRSTVLDIGTGIARALGELSDSPIGRKLNFFGTDLSRISGVDYYFDPQKILITSVEYLNGINNESIAVCLGMASIAYSVAPEFAIRRINEVLVPGGVLKATFRNFNDHYSDLDFKKHTPFTQELTRLGYDVSIKKSTDDNDPFDIVLAIKPKEPSVSAQKLMMLDWQTRDEQQHALAHYLWIKFSMEMAIKENESRDHQKITQPKQDNQNILRKIKVLFQKQ